MKRFAVVGYPVKHSLSPKIFNIIKELSKESNFNQEFSYETVEIAPENLMNSIDELKQYDGFNVTSPYKQIILEFCNSKSPEVEVLGAANVIANNNGKFKAYNTDIKGFIESLNPFKIKNKSALVLGSSGAARAAVMGLQKIGINEIYVKARDYSPFKRFGVSTKEYAGEAPQLIIQATTVGLNKELSDANEKDLEFFDVDYSKAELCYDLIYSPAMTPFMEIAQKNTRKVNVSPVIMNGLDMLILQALETYEIWSDQVGFSLLKKSLKEILKEIRERL